MCLKYCRNQLVNAWVDSWMAEFMDNAWVNKWLDGTIFIKNPCFTYNFGCFHVWYFINLERQVLFFIFADEEIKAHKSFNLMVPYSFFLQGAGHLCSRPSIQMCLPFFITAQFTFYFYARLSEINEKHPRFSVLEYGMARD